jgi:hypothetical protein
MKHIHVHMRHIGSLLSGTIVALILNTHMASAQVSVQASLSSTYDANAFRNSLGLADVVTTPSFTLGYQPEASNFHFTLSSAALLLGTYSERRFFTNSIGASYMKSFGDDDEHMWEAGAFYLSRLDRASYNFYDFSQLTAEANMKYYLDYENGLMGRAGYRFRSRRYSTLSEYSYREHYGYLQAAKFFETKTTLIAEFDLGYKQYTAAAADTTLSTVATGGGMMGMGASTSTMHGSSAAPGITQASILVRAAQSLAPGTGLSLQYLRRWNPVNHTLGLTIGGVAFQGDEELWDDPYGYEGPTYSAMLTAELLWDMTMRVSLEHADKSYDRNSYLATDTNVLTGPTGPLRADRKQTASVELRKTLDDVGMFDGLTLEATYSYVRNQSNEAYYDYSGSAVALGIDVNF